MYMYRLHCAAVHVCAAGIDVCLIGDSVGMVEQGLNHTLPVTMEEMLYHAKAVARGARRPLLVADLPFGSYENSKEEAYRNAIRFLKEGGMDCVKLEGGPSGYVVATHTHTLYTRTCTCTHITYTHHACVHAHDNNKKKEKEKRERTGKSTGDFVLIYLTPLRIHLYICMYIYIYIYVAGQL